MELVSYKAENRIFQALVRQRDVSGTDLGVQLSGFTGAQGPEAGNSSHWHGVTSSVGPQSQKLWATGYPLDFAACSPPIIP